MAVPYFYHVYVTDNVGVYYKLTCTSLSSAARYFTKWSEQYTWKTVFIVSDQGNPK